MLRSFFCEKLFHPLRCAAVGWHREVNRLYESSKETEWLDLESLLDLQVKKLRSLCKSSYENTAFYKKIFDDSGISPNEIDLDSIKKLPVLTKSIIRENFDGLINAAFDRDELIPSNTGGSSGEPLSFYSNTLLGIYRAVYARRCSEWAGVKICDRTIRLWSAIDDIKISSDSFKKRFINSIYSNSTVDAFNLDDEQFEDLYAELIRNPPKLLECYSNVLYEFARYLKDSKKDPIVLPSIISSAGTLYDFQRSVIAEMLGGNIFNRYGSREFGSIAQECSHHTGMHINMEAVIVEIDSSENNQPGNIFVTDLDNFVFPFIRYKIGDLGLFLREKCSCGRELMLIKEVSGRDLDIIRTPSGKMVSGLMFPHFFKSFPQIILGQVVQKNLENVEVRVKLVKGASLSDLGELGTAIKNILGPDINLTIRDDVEFKTNPTGKYRPVISLI